MSEPLNAHETNPWEGGPSFSLANRVERLAFGVAWRLLAWLVPPPLGWGWRRFLLRAFGAKMAKGAKVYPSARIWLPRNLEMGAWSALGRGSECYNQAPVKIGDHAIVSQRTYLCSGDHDYRDPTYQLVARPITIGNSAWIAAEAFIGPGVTVGDHAILGARGCAMKDIPAATIWAGNPATQIGERERD